MAGHSKWANIQHRKGRQDAKRGKIWTRLIREITVAARMGGGDLASNPRLRLAIEKANAVNMPKDNIQRATSRGVGGLDGSQYEEIRYEGYGVGGVAIIVDCMTDNRVRTVAEVRHAFSKNNGNLGAEGSVAYLFNHCGQFVFAPGSSEEQIMELALNAGADDIGSDEEGVIEVTCIPAVFEAVQKAFAQALLTPEVAEIVMKPSILVDLSEEDVQKNQKLLDALENLDDVQEVYSNTAALQ